METATKVSKNNPEWICTDPDNNQYGRKFSDILFQFKERGEESLIDLSGYKKSEIEDYINPYGYTLIDTLIGLQNVHKLYGSSANWIIAECIFEQESGLY